MAEVSQVDIVAGVPTGGTGEVPTLVPVRDALGAVADAAATQGSTGSVSAKLRTVTAQLNTLAGHLDGVEGLLAGSLTVGSHAVTNAGTFAVQAAATLAAETTKVIGTVNLAAAQTLATVTTVGAVTAITNALPAGTNNIGNIDVLTINGQAPAFNEGSTGATVLRTTLAGAATGTVAQVASSATSVTLQAANTARVGLTIFNDSTQVLYVKFGTTASATSYTIKMAAASYYEVPARYNGRIDGIWASANGNAYVTEIT